jgi:signal transduction histidine kinase
MAIHSAPAGSRRSPPIGEAKALAAALKQSQIDMEAEKCALGRTLHDDMGGLLIGAIMDMGWIADQPGLSDTVRKKLAKAQGLMRALIDMQRELIENLRPSLLDNVGLYSTLRWHMKASCRTAGVAYTECFPNSERIMNSETKIGVFRIIQEALKSTLRQPALADLSLTVEVIDDTLHCHLLHRSTAKAGCDNSGRSPETSMHLRAGRVGGTMQWSKSLAGRRHMHLQVPLPPYEQDGAMTKVCD